MKKIIAGAALLASLAPLQAAEQQFDWSFRYFGSHWGPELVDQSINGSFTVDDADQNGQFDLSELKSIKYQGTDYASCAGCTVSRFSFAPNGVLDFAIAWALTTESGSSSSGVNVGDRYFYYSWSPGAGEPYEYGGRWVAETIATVTPVPEPQTYLMLGAGLLAVAGVARRRRPAA